MAGRAGLGGREVSEELLSPEEVRSALRAYFADASVLDEARALRDDPGAFGQDGFDRERWRALAGEVGLVAMAGPEAAGGLGLGLVHLTAALEEAGACLYPGPVRASVLAAWTLSLLGAPDGVEDLLDGTKIVGMPQSFADRRPGVVLSADGRISGTVRAVTHGMSADVLLTLADSAEGTVPVLVRLDGDSGEVARRPVQATDLTATLADLELRAVPAAPGDTGAHDRTRDAARLLLAAEQVGGAQGCLAQTVDYAKIRTQFGQVIGGYQAIQHRCARVAIAVAGARALVLAAAKAIDSGDGEAAHQLVLLAKAEASEAFDGAADALIQVHGGIGFTWEHDAHLYFRRARAASALDGPPSRLRDDAVTAGCLSLLTRAPAG
ncbi:acyl-CoA dehydrogenase [Actinomadura sp. KC06]|uniref:acyl-CoA dehydrogenase family protein n=1 Tax=Actinomadura sp. KC06 TaxID=2530369 RepID=UPI0010513735|nr:acyl-CoA dehydrogenase family protein [Actinomadura sp. KC06]TDD40191.1 acyl-CoA dehydrogenase [Actinomadura sp. KC06]